MTAALAAGRPGPGPGLWLLGLATSGAAHVTLAWLLVSTLTPDPVDYRPQPEAEISVTAHAGRADRAEAAEPEAEDVGEAETQARRTTLARPPQSRAEPARIDAQPTGTKRPNAERLSAAAAPSARIDSDMPPREALDVEAPAAQGDRVDSVEPVAAPPLAPAEEPAGAPALNVTTAENAAARLAPAPETGAAIGAAAPTEQERVAAAAAPADQRIRPAAPVEPEDAAEAASAAQSVAAAESAAASQLLAASQTLAALDTVAAAPSVAAAQSVAATESGATVESVDAAESAAAAGAASQRVTSVDSVDNSQRIAAAQPGAAAQPVAASRTATVSQTLDGARSSVESQPVTASRRARSQSVAATDSGVATKSVAAAGPVGTVPLDVSQGLGTAIDPGPAPAASVDPTRPPQSSRVPGASDVLARLSAPAAAVSVADDAGAAPAALAWSGDADSRLDPQSLAAIQSFMTPKAADQGTSVRDGLDATLSGLPCSRLTAAFSPEGGTIEVRGHVRDAATGSEAVSRVREAVGASIPVQGDVLVLPEPQCSVLEGLDSLALPQSADQTDDPLVVGRAAQERYLALEEGEPMVFDFEAANYEAYIYIDYFDAEGQVTHLTPNAMAPLRMQPAGQHFSIGGENDESGVRLTIAPPFGKDIVVVIAATHPLFETERPLREDAASYLAELRERIATLQAAHSGFRGEWAYMFLETFPRGARRVQ